jgi:hypothetical protein
MFYEIFLQVLLSTREMMRSTLMLPSRSTRSKDYL